MCTDCNIRLHKKGIGREVNLPNVDSYDPNRTKNLRSIDVCNCKICKVAKSDFNATSARKKERGRPKIKNSSEDVKRSFKVCAKCYAQIHRVQIAN